MMRHTDPSSTRNSHKLSVLAGFSCSRELQARCVILNHPARPTFPLHPHRGTIEFRGHYGAVQWARAHFFVAPTSPMAAIGVLTLELRLEEAHSLKEKRHVVQGLKDRLRHKFNVAVAEIANQDTWQRATLAAVTVSGDRVFAEKVLQSVEEEAAAILGGTLVETGVEWVE